MAKEQVPHLVTVHLSSSVGGLSLGFEVPSLGKAKERARHIGVNGYFDEDYALKYGGSFTYYPPYRIKTVTAAPKPGR